MRAQYPIGAMLTLLLLLSAAAVSAQDAGLQAAFDALAADTTAEATDWFELAQRARSDGQVEIASDALDRAEDGSLPVLVALERARIAIVAEDTPSAVSQLQLAYAGGFASVQAMQGDAVLARIVEEPAFAELREEMERSAYPCRYDPVFAEFDFWIGDWDVHTGAGQLAGHNVIRRVEAGCVVTEHWTGTTGGTGSSINYVDKRTGEWVQVWNSEAGAQIFLAGGLQEGSMNLAGEIHYIGNGTTAKLRGLWTPLEDGRVRQYFEQSNDGGETWVPWFEGFYSRRDDEETD